MSAGDAQCGNSMIDDPTYVAMFEQHSLSILIRDSHSQDLMCVEYS